MSQNTYTDIIPGLEVKLAITLAIFTRSLKFSYYRMTKI